MNRRGPTRSVVVCTLRRGRVVSRNAGMVVLAATLFGGGCSGPAADPHNAATLEPTMKVARVDRGEIVSVRDVSVEPAVAGRVIGTSAKGPVSAAKPAPPARRPSLLGIPMTPGPQLVPGEEIMVRLSSGQYVLVLQERSSPAMARGEPVRVVTEVPEAGLGQQRTRVVREYQ